MAIQPEHVQKLIAKNMLAARERKGLTLADVARDSGVNEGILQGIELGRDMPTAAMLRALALVLGCSSDELLGLPAGAGFSPEARQILELILPWSPEKLSRVLRELKATEEPSPEQ